MKKSERNERRKSPIAKCNFICCHFSAHFHFHGKPIHYAPNRCPQFTHTVCAYSCAFIYFSSFEFFLFFFCKFFALHFRFFTLNMVYWRYYLLFVAVVAIGFGFLKICCIFPTVSTDCG